MSFILQPSDSLELLEKFGGIKAMRAAELSRADLPVPDWFCVTTSAMERFLRGNMLLEFLNSVGIEAEAPQRPSVERFEALAQEAEKRILGASVSPEVAKAIHAECNRLKIGGAFSVEASPLAEPELTTAPMHNQTSLVALLLALRKIWASLMGANAMMERLEHRRPVWPMSIGIMVSRSVRARVSGTAREVRIAGAGTMIEIESGWGHQAHTLKKRDRFSVSLEHGTVVSAVSDKNQIQQFGREGGIECVQLPDAERSNPSLTPNEALSIVALSVEARECLGRSGIMEWAMDDERLYCLRFDPTGEKHIGKV